MRRLGLPALAAGWIDQVLASASNFLLMILLARVASLSTFGVLGIGYSVLTLAVSVERSALGVRLGIDLARRRPDSDPDSPGHHVALASLCALALSLVAVAALLGLGWATPHELGGVLILALAAPIVLLEDVWRYAANAVRRPGVALAADGLWLAVVAVELVRSFLTPVAPQEAIVVWAGGAALACVVFLRSSVPVSIGVRGVRAFLSRGRRAALAADGALGGLTPVVIGLIVSAVASVATYGTLRAAGTVFGVVNTLTSGVSLALVPALAVRPFRGAIRLAVSAAGALVAVAVLWGGAVLVAPGSVGHALLGESWSSAQHIIPLAILEYGAVGAWACGNAILRVNGQMGTNLRVRTAHLATCALLLIVVGLAHGSVFDLAIVTATTALLAAVWTMSAASRSDPAGSADTVAPARLG